MHGKAFSSFCFVLNCVDQEVSFESEKGRGVLCSEPSPIVTVSAVDSLVVVVSKLIKQVLEVVVVLVATDQRSVTAR